MSAELINHFFGALYDKFKNGDIPTEQTFRDLFDSIPFFREIASTAQRNKGGLVKTTPDTKVNARDNSDVLGISPLGYKTFVQPAQIWQLIAGAGITLTPQVRGGAGGDDSGKDIEDIEISVNFPSFPSVPVDTDDLITSGAITLNSLTAPYPYTVTGGTIAAGVTVQVALAVIAGQVNNLVAEANNIADRVYADQLDAVATIEMTVQQPTSPNAWGTKYLEPVGQVLLIADYPELYAKIGVAFGGNAVTTFALPNMNADAYLRARLTTNTIGIMTGSNTYSLTASNIPAHTHSFSGTTDADGGHSHDIQTAASAAGTGKNDGSGGAYDDVDPDAISTEPDHTHTFSGTTGSYGASPVDPVDVTPRAFNTYIKMRVKP